MASLSYLAGFAIAKIGARGLIVASTAVTLVLIVIASMQAMNEPPRTLGTPREAEYKRLFTDPYEQVKADSIKSAWADVRDVDKPVARRLEALALLEKEQPVEFKTQQLEQLRPPLKEAQAKRQKLIDAADAKWQKEMAAVRKARAKSEGVSLGMTPEDVLASSWGKPTHINRTTTSYGESEQWVYRQYRRGYLYFKNGILETIQN